VESVVLDNILQYHPAHVYMCWVILKVLFSFWFIRISGLLGVVLLHF